MRDVVAFCVVALGAAVLGASLLGGYCEEDVYMEGDCVTARLGVCYDSLIHAVVHDDEFWGDTMRVHRQ
jgi:hypothetical protein